MEKQEAMVELIHQRRSCKEYRPEPVEREVLARIVEAGRYAPSGMNRQLCRFYVIDNPAVLAAVTEIVSRKKEGFAGKDCRYGAPALVVVTNRRENGVALQDTACALENMMLAACALGVGSRWINQPYALSEDPELRALLEPAGLTDGERICGSLALGYPAGELFPGPRERTGNQVVWVP